MEISDKKIIKLAKKHAKKKCLEMFIKRTSDDGVQTLGELSVNDINGVTL